MAGFGVFLPTFGYPAITMDFLKAAAKSQKPVVTQQESIMSFDQSAENPGNSRRTG